MLKLLQQVFPSINKYRLFILFQSLCAYLLVIVVSSWTFPLSVDSFHFITSADQLIKGQGLTFSNFFVEIPSSDFLPVFLQPPGYTLLIAGFKKIGIDTTTAAILIPRICYICLPFLFFSIFRRIISNCQAVWASFICTFIFTCLSTALMAWSDIPYLCVSLIAIIGVFKIIESDFKVNGTFIVFAGLTTGTALLIRYTGTGLILAIGFTFVLACAIRLIPLKKAWSAAVYYVLGIIIIITPYLIRNWLVFKNIQPFHLPPNHDSLLTVVSDYLTNLSQVLFAQPNGAVFVLIVIVGTCLVLIRYCKVLIRENKLRFTNILIIANYFIFNSLFLIYCRAQNFTEAINERYIIAFAWSLIALIAVSVSLMIDKQKSVGKRKVSAWIPILALIVFILIQSLCVVEEYYKQQKITLLALKIQKHLYLIDQLPPDIVIVSNVADITYYFAKRNVRLLGRYSPQDLINNLGTKRRFVVFLVKEGKYLSPFWSYLPVWDQSAGYRIISSDPEVDLLSPYYR